LWNYFQKGSKAVLMINAIYTFPLFKDFTILSASLFICYKWIHPDIIVRARLNCTLFATVDLMFISLLTKIINTQITLS